MKKSSVVQIHELFLSLYKIPVNKAELRLRMKSVQSEVSLSPLSSIDWIRESGALAHLSYITNWMHPTDFINQLDRAHFPMLVFKRQDGEVLPLVLYKEGGKMIQYEMHETGIQTAEFKEDTVSDLLKEHMVLANPEHPMRILMLTAFPHDQLTIEAQEKENYMHSHAMRRFLHLLKSEKREIVYVYIYAIIAGIIGLSLPLGVQSIIGFISSGQVSTSVVVLITFVILGILITGGLQVMQFSLVERIQQRLFTKTAFEFAFRIPKIKIESVIKSYPPELMNRFFDIVTLQKGLAKILLEFSAALLQIVLGLLLLSFYHSSFIFFGIFLVVVLVLIIRYTGIKGLKTSLKESKYKYQVANWLEEIARALSTFKLAGYSNLPVEKTDYFVSNYLYARKSHFSILVTQYISFVFFKTFITGGLLIMGCILLIDKQINIGQFVASEIVIILIMNAVEKIIIHLDTVYDVLTSMEKIGTVTDLPIELPWGIHFEENESGEAFALSVKGLRYKYPSESEYILKGIDIDIRPTEHLCLSGYSSSGKTTFVNIILGFLTSYEGIVAFNNISLRSINKNSLIRQIGDNVSQEDLFEGTLLENIALGRNHLSLADILWAIECVGLNEFLHSQPDGLDTKLINGSMGISESIARKIIIARSIVHKPKLLILEDVLMGLEKESKLRLVQTLLSPSFKWTLIIISNDEDLMKLCDRTIIMKQGAIVADGPYEQLKNSTYFKELI